MSVLDTLCRELDFQNGSLFSVSDSPSAYTPSDWLEKGEWFAAASRAGAEKLFFVNNNPIVVFAESDNTQAAKITTFNRAWCLARPRLLFLACEGEITVYDLGQKPVDETDENDKADFKALETLTDIRDVARKLNKYHRYNLESGRLFNERHFGGLKNRADHALIRDLKIVRHELIAAGLSGTQVCFAHALIGRSIFIRYLEDRGILTLKYFENVASQRSDWLKLIKKPQAVGGVNLSNSNTIYPRVLEDKEFTYALFKRLADDFNGDMFPEEDNEEIVVNQHHLSLIQGLLYGKVGVQKKLFFYSYQFDIVPLDLISSIYEEFYHSSIEVNQNSNARQDGAFYTPPVLAEFVLSRILTHEVLTKKVRVLDPACGSGIFLVEAFRRIVRQKWQEKKALLTFDELKTILKEQISGIEVNKEAASIAAFSLYLSMLHFLDPPDIIEQIRDGNRLPNLVASEEQSPNHFHSILPINAFDTAIIDANPIWRERFGKGCADIVVGNPPWGEPGRKVGDATKNRQAALLNWCIDNDQPIGDKEASQAFLWRAHDLLREGGIAGMLVSTGVFLKHSSTTQEFRKRFFDVIELEEVFNFSHVRKVFFKSVISPFASIKFIKNKTQNSHVTYWSIKETIFVKSVQAVIISNHDRHLLAQEDLIQNKVWKVCLWGSTADWKFIKSLNYHTPLKEFVDRERCGQGFKKAPPEKSAKHLGNLRSLKVTGFSRYDNLTAFEPTPEMLYRLGNEDCYEGTRLLIKRGISQKGRISGRVISRLEEQSFSFSSALIGLKFINDSIDDYKFILGILWSSFSRYYFFLISSTWGIWHDELDIDGELLTLPIPSVDSQKKQQIIKIVDKLRSYHPEKQDVFNPNNVPEATMFSERERLETKLDEVVYLAYGLSWEQKDLIRDCCDVTLPFYYKPLESIGSMPAVSVRDSSWIESYVQSFGRRWCAYLNDGEEMRAEVHLGAQENILAVEFFPADADDPWDLTPECDSWGKILEQIGMYLPHSIGGSEILLDTLVHVITDNGIFIIKRNVKRYWTSTTAREDADATICKRLLDDPVNDREV